MTDLEKLAEHIISAQYSYDTPTQKAELIRAFIDGATAERNGLTHDTQNDRRAYIQTYKTTFATVTLIISAQKNKEASRMLLHSKVFNRLYEVMNEMIKGELLSDKPTDNK